MDAQEIHSMVDSMRVWYKQGASRPVKARKQALTKLRDTILAMEDEINAALKADLNKSETETYMCETGMTLAELNYVRKHFAKWDKKHRVLTPLAQFPSKSYTVQEPYGVVLIMSPWNYPFMLTMAPLVGAIAAGNCCVVKPSAYSPATSAIIAKIVEACFPKEWVTVIRGGRAENQALLDQKFDYIFFTGGVNVGKEVMRRASETLTPVTLELGGKSPVIVDKTAKLKVAARRLTFGKLLNSGQTCVAADYLLIHKSVKDEFLGYVKQFMQEQYGTNAIDNEGYVHIINDKHYERIMGLIDPAKVVLGGKGDPVKRAIQPTILDNVSPGDAVMQEEIFGPILPVLTFDDIEEAITFINDRPHPLALYLFTEDKQVVKRFQADVPFGGGCINDTIMHIVTSRMPFGGVGDSGMGGYHGKYGYDTFSHKKSVLNKATWLDMPVRYAPYSKLQKKLLRIFLK